jgi:signal transduction histidine kinase
LNVAVGHLEMARGDCDSEHLGTADDALERMDTIIETTLALARYGQAVTDEEVVDVPALADRCWEMVESPDVSLAVVDDFEIRAAPERLSHLFENLFRNAVEHGSTNPDSQARQDAVEHGSTSPDSPPREAAGTRSSEEVTIRVGSMDEGFYVEDDGPGIPEDVGEDVLEPGRATTDLGTGFGLAIVKQITEAHGWEVDVTDGDDGGARFEVSGVDVLHEGAT